MVNNTINFEQIIYVFNYKSTADEKIRWLKRYLDVDNGYAKSGILNESLKMLTYWYDAMFVILPM